MEFDVNDIDMKELERQRYDAIKKAGKYIEVDILIGAKENTKDTPTSIRPVITTTLHGAKPTEIGAMYIMLKEMAEHFQENYPMECLLALMTTKSRTLGTAEYDIDDKDDDKSKEE